MDPIIDGLQFTQVLMDGGSDINLLYQDTIRRMGIDPTKIRRSSTSFKGVTPGLFSQFYRLCTTRGRVRFIRQPPSRKAHPPSPHLAVALKHYWGVQLSPALMQYHITRILRLKNARSTWHILKTPGVSRPRRICGCLDSHTLFRPCRSKPLKTGHLDLGHG